MSTRLTYTSGDLGAETDAAFEQALEAARASDAATAPAPDRRRGGREGEPFERRDPARTERRGEPRARGRAGARAASGRGGAGGRARLGAARPTRSAAGSLRAAADGIGERHMELAALASLETGKSRTESILEVQEAIDLIEAYAGHMEENEGYTRRSTASWRASATWTCCARTASSG